jgi:hypothetical protein
MGFGGATGEGLLRDAGRMADANEEPPPHEPHAICASFLLSGRDGSSPPVFTAPPGYDD